MTYGCGLIFLAVQALRTDVVCAADILDAFACVYFAQYGYDLFRGVSFLLHVPFR